MTVGTHFRGARTITVLCFRDCRFKKKKMCHTQRNLIELDTEYLILINPKYAQHNSKSDRVITNHKFCTRV